MPSFWCLPILEDVGLVVACLSTPSMILTFVVTNIEIGAANCATIISAIVGGGPVPSTQFMVVVRILRVGQVVCTSGFPSLFG